MKQWMTTVMVSVLSLGVLTGCNRGGCGREPQGEVPETSSIDQLRVEIADLKIEQGREAAIARMRALLKDEAQAEFKPSVAEWLMDEYLEEDAVEAVQDAYLSLSSEDEEFAKLGFRRIMAASSSSNMNDTAIWYDKILAAPVSDAMKTYIWRLRAGAYGAAGSIAPCVERLDEMLELEVPEQHLAAVSAVAGEGLRIKDYAGLDALLAAVRETCSERDDLLQSMLVLEADMLLQQEKLDEAEAFLNAQADALGDAALKGLVTRLLSVAGEPMAVRVVAAAYAAGDERPATRDAAALRWISAAADGGQYDAFLTRLEEAMDAGCHGASLVQAFQNGFYIVMAERDAALQERCSAIAERLYAGLDEDDSRLQSMALMLLDGAFYAQDFKRALAVVEGGVHGYGEKWHVEMKDKIGAHLALQEGRPEDALVLFGKHMERVLVWEAPIVNPENGSMMIKEAVMGFNEKRIGDIYSGMDGRTADAEAAYARARDWYQQALEILEPDSAEHKEATSELAVVPGV